MVCVYLAIIIKSGINQLAYINCIILYLSKVKGSSNIKITIIFCYCQFSSYIYLQSIAIILLFTEVRIVDRGGVSVKGACWVCRLIHL